MAEVKTELKAFQVDCTCNTCKVGKMRPTGFTFMSNPPQYPHECAGCGARETFLTTYPRISYEEITEPVSQPIGENANGTIYAKDN